MKHQVGNPFDACLNIRDQRNDAKLFFPPDNEENIMVCEKNYNSQQKTEIIMGAILRLLQLLRTFILFNIQASYV